MNLDKGSSSINTWQRSNDFDMYFIEEEYKVLNTSNKRNATCTIT
jgi:hypothetical protein